MYYALANSFTLQAATEIQTLESAIVTLVSLNFDLQFKGYKDFPLGLHKQGEMYSISFIGEMMCAHSGQMC